MCGLDFLSNDEILNWYDSIRNANLNNKKIATFGKDLINDVKIISQLITIRG